MDVQLSNETKKATTKKSVGKISGIRRLTVTAMLSAVAYALMFIDFPIPFLIPSFIQMDISELPALIGAFAMGPVCGICVCLVKNLLHLFITTTGGVGELSNFLLGVAFVLPAGLVYKHKKSKKSALIGSLLGAVLMGLVSIPIKYFLTYPIYYNFLPEATILEAYQAILSFVDNILECLVIFNMPFTMVKGLLVAVITMMIYKHISPILKGTQNQ